jgi:hypothetical protein
MNSCAVNNRKYGNFSIVKINPKKNITIYVMQLLKCVLHAPYWMNTRGDAAHQ